MCNNSERYRPRLFTADELLAIALAFEVPLVRLFDPPEDLPDGLLRSDLKRLIGVEEATRSTSPGFTAMHEEESAS
ncbi:MAG: hypothetical protein QNL26_02375 [Acidimicrobiia bacterium]|nr:hypothetical protein [Acidimicrobiia bacterium]